ncbi:MAG: type I-C CRISPR-associated protein Cas8c/Csd1, partial [Spirochaetaceae bacterium]|nr:type I-C CRISPR-associated protein Cas8c/Csd1 [Spirochaetaceae bacterium]
PIHTVSAPSPEEIVKAAFGRHLRDDIKAKTVQRLLPCIIDRSAIPPDIERRCFGRALRLNTLKTSSEQEKMLETACAVIRYNLYTKNKEDYTVGLEEDCKNRDYLYGRLLAVADRVEMLALTKPWETPKRVKTRATNAVRYMQRFSRLPCSTWKFLYVDKLHSSYFPQLGERSGRYERLIQDIKSLFEHGDYVSDKPLTGEFLLGYHCQQKAFRDRAKLNTGNKPQPVNEDNEEDT